MNNIFKNSFYESKPMVKWNFQVNFVFHDNEEEKNLDQSNASKNVELCEILTKALTNIKLPEVKVDNFDTYFPGLKFSYPGLPTVNGIIDIKFNDDQHFTVRKILDRFMQYNYNPRFGFNDTYDTGHETYISEVHKNDLVAGSTYSVTPRFDIYVRFFNLDGAYVQKLVFKCCFVSAITGQDLSYDSEEVVDVTASIVYPYLKVLDIDPDEAVAYEMEFNRSQQF